MNTEYVPVKIWLQNKKLEETVKRASGGQCTAVVAPKEIRLKFEVEDTKGLRQKSEAVLQAIQTEQPGLGLDGWSILPLAHQEDE